ncbi:MAG: single-stranded DNA-binding protein [Blastocatellales bacterium]
MKHNLAGAARLCFKNAAATLCFPPFFPKFQGEFARSRQTTRHNEQHLTAIQTEEINTMSAFAQITGRLGQDPVLNYTNGGTPVVNLSVASNRQKKDAGGEKINLADWYRISMFGRNAEIIAEYAKKGSALAFNGRLQVDSYIDREGVERTSVCLIADCFEFMPGTPRTFDAVVDELAEEMKEESNGKASAGKPKREAKGNQDPDENIPF